MRSGARRLQPHLVTRGHHNTVYGVSSDRRSDRRCHITLPEDREMGRAPQLSLGPENDIAGLQASVCSRSPSFLWYSAFSGAQRVSSCSPGGNSLAIGKESNMRGASRTMSERLLFQVFPGPQTRRDRDSPNPGSPGSEQIPQNIPVQDAYTRIPAAYGASERLVHVSRPQRRIFPHSDISSSQEISEVCFSGCLLRVQSAALRVISEPKGVCALYGSGHCPAAATGHQAGHVPGRLAPPGTVQRGRHRANAHPHKTPDRPGFYDKLGKECIISSAENNLPGVITRLGVLHGPSVSGEGERFQSLPLAFHPAQSGPLQIMPPTTGPDGFGHPCSPARPSVHEGFSAVGAFPQAESRASWCTEGDGQCAMRNGTASLAPPGLSGDRGAYGPRTVPESDHHRREHVGLGWYMRGPLREGRLERGSPARSHKLPRALGGVSHAETLSPASQGTSCPGENGQYDDGGIYQPSRRSALPAITHAGTQTDPVEQRPPPVSESHPCPGGSEPGGGPVVQGCAALRGMDVTSSPRGAGVGPLWQSHCGSVRVERERAMSAVFLNTRSRCAARRGRARARLAVGPPICFSPVGFDSPDSGQSQGASPHAGSDSSAVAGHALASGGLSAPVGAAMAASPPQGYAVTGRGSSFSPTSGAPGSLGLAPEWCNLNTAGLPQNVINTIQSARAASTRSLYDCKWRVFEEWCQKKGHISFQCTVGVILSFLQDLIDKRKAFSTIKVYLAAIAACHVGFGGKTVSQHPLVCRFMKGARRLLPVCRPLAPPWDLAVVLNGLSRAPFEPLEEVSLKHLSLKTALLLALASAKRVSDIHALSVHSSCTQFAPGNARVSLKPHLAFVPKVVGSCSPIVLTAFSPPPFSSPEEQRLHMLCPVRALRIYMDRTMGFREGDQLFVSWARPCRGRPITKQRLSHWIVGAIALAYTCQGLQAPVGLRAHSTRGLAASWALCKGVSIQEICAAASWSSPLTFVRFYKLDIPALSLAHAVLTAGLS
ncbi:uncharacterized protein LOC115409064 [Salarias fasciatus]|uniref:uncharacterized protein LOC115409064 n=1 Tax=Salarias fasciatus TaxID=181472 RepID=UPI001176AB97|nr:uncharacterized protein LOC115409064 [Salarias fasciatus]